MRLILEVAQVVAPVFLLAAIGFGWVRRGWAYDVEFVTRLAMTLSIPCLIFMALVRSDVDPRLLRDTVLAALAAYAAVGATAGGWSGGRARHGRGGGAGRGLDAARHPGHSAHFGLFCLRLPLGL